MNFLRKYCFLTFLFIGSFILSQTVKSDVWVNGECGMCKERIENTAKKTGALFADWNVETKKLTLEFDLQKTTLDLILQNIAKAGHDNENHLATQEAYDALHDCCHYHSNEKSKIIADSISKNNTDPNQITDNLEVAEKTEPNQFYVKGNCTSCKTRIENAAKNALAESAVWDANTQLLSLKFNPKITSSEKILLKIAEVGHDNELYKASDLAYKRLPECCLYPRDIPVNAKNHLVHFEEEEEHTASEHKNFDKNNLVDKSIEEITIVKSQDATALNRKSTGLTFTISEKELLKAACCNLSESFETNATVDVSFSNAVTGTKQLKMLGLDQKYTSLTKELLPEIRGLASPYGLNFIPGRWIGGIQLTKGGSTVTNGYEGITGQINTELLKFKNKPETTLNIFADINSRTEANITHTSFLSEHWSNTILLHGNGTFSKMDYNQDGFLDQPTGTQMNIAYLLDYQDMDHSGWGSHSGINFLQDKRNSGQMDFTKKRDQSEQLVYGVGIDISRFQLWNKTGYIFKNKPYQSVGFMNQFTYHQQDSFFGWRDYFGKQTTYYSNLIFESIFGNTNHKYKTGASFLYDKYDEDYLNENFKRTETVPGFFFEYALSGLKYTLVAGVRTDFHNLAGTQLTPRLNFKYDLFPKTILRISAGRGFRTANLFAESQAYFASNREIEILRNGGKIYGLKPEIAWNYGISLQQELKIFGNKSSIIADFFRTDFQDQVLLDLDQSPQKIKFYNLDGKSWANSFQTQWDFSPFKGLEVRLAYKYYDVQADFEHGRREIPFMAKHRAFLNLAYATTKNNAGGFWSFDTTLNIVGKQRLPNLNTNPLSFRLPKYSEGFYTLNAQIGKNFNDKIRIYAGGENLTSVTQDNPIIDVKNPFGNYFDGGMVYAPIMPLNIYLGFDFKF